MSDYQYLYERFADPTPDEPDEDEQDDYPTETTEPPEDENPF